MKYLSIKKSSFLRIMFVLCLLVYAQETKAQATAEVGFRFGPLISVEGTMPIAAAPRFHPAIYLDRFGIGAYFDWMFALTNGPEGLKFFPGVGPEFFFENRFDFSIAGDFGVEYAFHFPLTLAFDWRPAMRFTNDFDFLTNTWGFSARFRFGDKPIFKKTN